MNMEVLAENVPISDLTGIKTLLIVGKSKKRSDTIINLYKELNKISEINVCNVDNLNSIFNICEDNNIISYIFDKHFTTSLYRHHSINDLILQSYKSNISVIISVNEISDIPSIIRHLIHAIIFTDVIVDKEIYLIYYDKMFRSYDLFISYININLEFNQCLIFINSNEKQRNVNIFQLK